MKYLKPSLHILLTLTFLWICWFSFTIYTSLMGERLPWYEPCGMQFLAILIFSCPVMVAIGISYLVLGRSMPISKITRLLPFATAGVLGILVFGPLSFVMQITGTACCIVAALVAIICVTRDLTKKRSEQTPAGDVLKAAPDE